MNQFLALLIVAVLPAINAVRTIVIERRVSAVTMFVLTAMALSVAMSLISGRPRALLIRDAWGTAAIGLWILVTLLAQRPFLHVATRGFLDDGRQTT